jgi:type 1 glutamine amidotransferase
VRRELVGLLAVALAAAGCADRAAPERAGPAPTGAGPYRVLLFTRTTGFRHASIPAAVAAVERLGAGHGFAAEHTEDPARFDDAALARYRVVVFLNTTGDVLDGAQQAALERWVTAGGGFVGVHSAADTEYGWAWYGTLLGARFARHPAVQPATVRVVDRDHPATAGLPARWRRTDEWYDLRANPRGRVHVLATVDEATYTGGGMGADHPIAWCQRAGEGRSLYTAGGHTVESWAEPRFLAHVAGAIGWAAGAAGGDCAPPPEPA